MANRVVRNLEPVQPESIDAMSLKERLSSLFPQRSLSRFLSIGLLNTLVGVSVFPLLYWVIGPTLNVNVILSVSYIFCTIFAFTAHKFVTFRSQGRTHVEGARFFIVSGVTYLLNVGLLNATLPLTPSHPVLLQLGIAIALQIFNFFILGKIVFPSLVKGRDG
jgi:putative flippase GtrA